MDYKAIIFSLNNKQLEHIASSFRVFGIAFCLATIANTQTTAADTIAMIVGWVLLEFFSIVTLSYLKTEDSQ